MTRLSDAQHGMWINERMGAGTVYHMPVVIRFGAPPDPGALAKACASVVERHALLGMAVEDRDGVPYLVPAAVRPELAERREIDLERGPLITFTLSGDELRVVAHHLIFDGQSKDILVADLLAYYRGASPEPARPAQTPPAGSVEGARAFWAERWREPGDTFVPGGALRSRRAGPGRVLEFSLDLPPLVEPPLDGLTRFEVLLAAVHGLLNSYGNTDVVTALDLSTRTPAQEGHIGPFVNELPIFSRPMPDASFAEFAASLRAELRQVYGYRDIPLARAVPGLRPHAALAPVSVSYRRATVAEQDVEVEWLAFNQAVRGALQLQVLDHGDRLTASLRYNPDEPVAPERFAADLGVWLAAVAEDPYRPLSTLGAVTGGGAEGAELGDISEMSPSSPRTQIPAASVPGSEDPLLAEITAIWEEVLQMSPIEPDDDVFDLGGHSLTITQIIARMRKRLNVDVSLDDFFDNPTIAGVLQVIRK